MTISFTAFLETTEVHQLDSRMVLICGIRLSSYSLLLGAFDSRARTTDVNNFYLVVLSCGAKAKISFPFSLSSSFFWSSSTVLAARLFRLHDDFYLLSIMQIKQD
jgi:hypothetical protein